jgi:hypothetical protein
VDADFLGKGEPVKTELELLVLAIEEMDRIRRDVGYIPAQKMRHDIVRYFRLNHDINNTFVFDELKRLAGLPAGSLKEDE